MTKKIEDIADTIVPGGSSVYLCNDSIILLLTRDAMLEALDAMEDRGDNKVIIAIPFDKTSLYEA